MAWLDRFRKRREEQPAADGSPAEDAREAVLIEAEAVRVAGHSPQTAAVTPEAVLIEIDAAGTRVNGHPVDLLTLAGLTSALGPPRTLTDRGMRYATWDSLGISATLPDGAVVGAVRLVVNPSYHPEFQRGPLPSDPSSPFAGRLLIDGEPADQRYAHALAEPDLSLPTITLTSRVAVAGPPGAEVEVAFKRLSHTTSPGPGWILISPRTPVRPRRRRARTVAQRSVRGPVMTFSSFAWKALVVEELMFTRDLLKPRFDVDEFCASRGIDPDSDQEIPDVRRWFEELPVPATLGTRITSLSMDAGNLIYQQLVPRGDDDPEVFDAYRLTHPSATTSSPPR